MSTPCTAGPDGSIVEATYNRRGRFQSKSAAFLCDFIHGPQIETSRFSRQRKEYLLTICLLNACHFSRAVNAKKLVCCYFCIDSVMQQTRSAVIYATSWHVLCHRCRIKPDPNIFGDFQMCTDGKTRGVGAFWAPRRYYSQPK